MSILKTAALATATRAGVVLGVVAASVVGLAPSSQAAGTTATQPAVTLSAANGAITGGQSLTVTSATNKFYSGKLALEFQTATSLTANCSTNYSTPASGTIVAVVTPTTASGIISAKKLSIVVPSLGASTTTPTTWLLCIYNSTSTTTSTLLGKAGYTASGAPTVPDAAGAVLPTSGPSYGGQTITVTGTNFVSGLTATLGGAALTDINVVDSTTFTATTPAHVGSSGTGTAVALSVTTPGGSAQLLSSATNKYSYVDAISVWPQQVTTPSQTAMDVTGYGFNATFTAAAIANTDGLGTHTDQATPHVYLLLNGSYSGVNNAGAKTTPQKNECTGVQVISDSELVCTLDTDKSSSAVIDTTLTGTDTAAGLYQLAIVMDGTIGAHTGNRLETVLSGGSAVTVSAF